MSITPTFLSKASALCAVVRGLAMNIYEAMNNRILDYDYTLSFGRLHEFIAGTDKTQIARAVLFGSGRRLTTQFGSTQSQPALNWYSKTGMWPTRKKRSTLASCLPWSRMRISALTKPRTQWYLWLEMATSYQQSAISAKTDSGVDVVFWDHVSKELKDSASSFTAPQRSPGVLTSQVLSLVSRRSAPL